MAISYVFGRNTVGATNFSFPLINSKSVSRFQLTTQTDIECLVASHNTASSTAKVKGVIYADNAGEPGAMVASTNEKGFVAVAWNVFTFASPVTLAPGYYWLGLISDTALTSYGAATTGTNRYNNDTYSDGPSNPFGTPATSTTERPIYAAVFSADTPDKLSISKSIGYAVLSTEVTVGISKVVGYAVLSPGIDTGNPRPVVFVCT